MSKKRPYATLSLRCACSGILTGKVWPVVAAMKIRDIFILTHTDEGCAVTDDSTLSDQSVFLRTVAP